MTPHNIIGFHVTIPVACNFMRLLLNLVQNVFDFSQQCLYSDDDTVEDYGRYNIQTNCLLFIWQLLTKEKVILSLLHNGICHTMSASMPNQWHSGQFQKFQLCLWKMYFVCTMSTIDYERNIWRRVWEYQMDNPNL